MRIRQPRTPEQPQTMDTGHIGPVNDTPYEPWTPKAFSGALFAESSGLYRLPNPRAVFSLVLAGFKGYQFGDDGTMVGYVATELPLDERYGRQRLQQEVEAAVTAEGIAPYANFLGEITTSEATVMLVTEVKAAFDVPQPSMVSFDGGSRSTSGLYVAHAPQV